MITATVHHYAGGNAELVAVELEPYPFENVSADPWLNGMCDTAHPPQSQMRLMDGKPVWLAKSIDRWSRAKWWLVYSHADALAGPHHGTGPFDSQILAIEWYANGGR